MTIPVSPARSCPLATTSSSVVVGIVVVLASRLRLTAFVPRCPLVSSGSVFSSTKPCSLPTEVTLGIPIIPFFSCANVTISLPILFS
ncbi:hypothetical protein RvY_10591 [Ramazzottius varieornatus]|uniref:Uncharacterized protein n=1 Tax=Ramazzottius varieornatus TaxID=947166 RepID=A0A1D1VL30_RAMVA|nr:hypothetical protein RvY_10591 [Ramazzottius varieornatus]